MLALWHRMFIEGEKSTDTIRRVYRADEFKEKACIAWNCKEHCWTEETIDFYYRVSSEY